MNLIKPLAGIMLVIFISIFVFIYFQSTKVQTDYLSVYDPTAEGDSYSFKSKTRTEEDDYISTKYSRFTGLYTFAVVDFESGVEITIDYRNSTEKGYLAIVVVDQDMDVIQEIENPDEGSITLNTVKKGQAHIRMVGYKSSGTVDFSIMSDKEIDIEYKK